MVDVGDLPDCAKQLTPDDLTSVCGSKVALKDTGMADGRSQICSRLGAGFIFLLSRLSQPDKARRAADVAFGGTGTDGAKIADRAVHLTEWPTGGNVAVAPASNLLLELRSLDDMPTPRLSRACSCRSWPSRSCPES